MTSSLPSIDTVLLISIAEQFLYHWEGGKLIGRYLISSAENGIGNQSGSNQTPLGLHTVCEKYGEGLPLGAVLSSRKFTGEIAQIDSGQEATGRDLITSRILRLCGKEPGLNQGSGIDSYERYIYIHGTPEEGRLGMPASHGCIRMANTDIITLYPAVSVGMKVLIVEEVIPVSS